MGTDSSLAPHVQDIKRALENDTSEEEIESELKRFLALGVDIVDAKPSVIKRFGGIVGPRAAAKRQLAELQGTEPNVHVTAKVLKMAPKVVTVRGEERSIVEGFLGDSSAVLAFTCWVDAKFQEGDVIEVKGAYARRFRDKVQVNIGNRATVANAGPDQSFKVAAAPGDAPSELKLGEVTHGQSNITVTAKVADVASREVTARGAAKTVFSGTLVDDTGRVAFTAWSDFKLKVGEVIRVQGAYVKSWRGIAQLTFDERSRLERVESSPLTAVRADSNGPMTIEELTRLGGAFDVTVEAVVIEIKGSSGLIQRCPECKRVITSGSCTKHGQVQGVADMRVKAVIDDSTGAMIAVLNSEATQKLLGKGMEEARAMAATDGKGDPVYEELARRLIGRPLAIRGNVSTDEFGIMMIGTQADLVTLDVSAQAGSLLAKMGVE